MGKIRERAVVAEAAAWMVFSRAMQFGAALVLALGFRGVAAQILFGTAARLRWAVRRLARRLGEHS